MAALVETKTYNLEIENELRIIVGEVTTAVKIKLVSGLAEIFGAEMEHNETYTFPTNAAVAIFTWYGCTIKVTGNPQSVNVFTDTHMILNLHLHAALEKWRIKSEKEDKKGPITLIVGPKDVGKTTLCHFLLNYAARSGRCPLFIDLDVGQNSISLPGTISVNAVGKPLDIVSGFEDEVTEVYYFGCENSKHNTALYSLLLKRLGQNLRSRFRRTNKDTKFSGVIINTRGWKSDFDYEAITLAALAFKIDVLCVLQEGGLYQKLLKDVPSSVKVVFIPKLDGVVIQSRRMRSKLRDVRIREYFYRPTNQLRPFVFDVKYSEIQVFRVLARPLREVFESMVNATLDYTSLVPVPLDNNLIDHIVALTSADTVQKDLILTPVIGFIRIASINTSTNIITVLSPQPGPLPKKILLIGSIKVHR
ncbi:protein CLP1 homolog [Trichonephila inaurata madagascariensis]|uniref:Protein CLP1 homolog n=1 Tax=Trichonephila inaurata madagascariensis TaxID=2747483 RepID=A0A8X7CSB8_9ARAC|nr:protein CLP1 homolog [Trichonephila inaurata madagascariensis]